MSDKILMNKNTLTALKTELGEYRDALPVFEMKEQQLKEVVRAVESSILQLTGSIQETNNEIKSWVAVMAEDEVDLTEVVKVARVVTETREIAGVAVYRVIIASLQP